MHQISNLSPETFEQIKKFLEDLLVSCLKEKKFFDSKVLIEIIEEVEEGVKEPPITTIKIDRGSSETRASSIRSPRIAQCTYFILKHIQKMFRDQPSGCVTLKSTEVRDDVYDLYKRIDPDYAEWIKSNPKNQRSFQQICYKALALLKVNKIIFRRDTYSFNYKGVINKEFEQILLDIIQENDLVEYVEEKKPTSIFGQKIATFKSQKNLTQEEEEDNKVKNSAYYREIQNPIADEYRGNNVN